MCCLAVFKHNDFRTAKQDPSQPTSAEQNLCERRYTLLWPRFSTSSPELGQYQTTVILPNNAPVQQAVGKVHSKKSLAIGSACLIAIQALYEVRKLLL